MAISTLNPQPVPDPLSASYVSPKPASIIREEVEAAQINLRNRLAGAIRKPPPNVPVESLPTVPLIDIGASFDGSLDSRKTIARQIHEACVTTGFFQISNHGVTEEAMAGVLKQAERFFHELPQEKKHAMHIKYSPLFRGYEPHDYTYVNPDDKDPDGRSSAQQETKEGFNWGYEEAMDPSGGDGKYVELDGVAPATTGIGNVWPAEDDLPGFHATISLYYSQVLELARHLFRLFALSLDLEEDYFDPLMTHPGGIARLLYYAGQPALDKEKTDEEVEFEGKLGLGAHTDYECFTLLLSSTNPGLEILFPPSPLTNNLPIWRPCPVRPGTLTVNVADFLMRWTNGLYKSTIHRVVSKPGAGERYSVPFFFSINYDSEVTALPERCVGKSRFLPLKAGEYILERLKATQT
ncbi:uncharacterized protein Z518_01584 [Rhinocladiella mackenziei CBS 650.93]|uniref:Rhinocladiella mackenziei CBS 650.93 unplaced genomic scaffold supercont1.1, whole genome shotgun sequence n=1 Tax=Rhinocladiella mackenziei CBS 650.93 TaxID=1442369 RepID=A0A0D2J4A9_9EURO|nr:uncharacterized protein Z518_01584 [Rhinocladiella mackenziei CBS 650.93]KIX10501.1 hypothetical protein Z518_01584 [Rhinocladiella mackenziei CBS 650.93]